MFASIAIAPSPDLHGRSRSTMERLDQIEDDNLGAHLMKSHIKNQKRIHDCQRALLVAHVINGFAIIFFVLIFIRSGRKELAAPAEASPTS